MVWGCFFLFYFCFGGGCVAVQSNALTSGLSDLATTASNAVADLAGVQAGADVLASQFVDVKNAMQDLVDFANTMRNSGYYTPVGSLMPFAAATAPDGWYLCNGATWASLSLSAGSPLYDLLQPLGYLGVPDLQGRTVVGIGTHADVNDLNDTEGEATVANRTPKHTHNLGTHTHTINDHAHSNGDLFTRLIPSTQNVWYGVASSTNDAWYNNWNGGGMSLVNNSVNNYFNGGIDIGGSTSGSGQLTSNGPSTNTSNISTAPYITLNYIIKS
jgi:microcystin-dependent protein